MRLDDKLQTQRCLCYVYIIKCNIRLNSLPVRQTTSSLVYKRSIKTELTCLFFNIIITITIIIKEKTHARRIWMMTTCIACHTDLSQYYITGKERRFRALQRVNSCIQHACYREGCIYIMGCVGLYSIQYRKVPPVYLFCFDISRLG